MNKIFKVVWSKTKNSYVVVSEFAKRSGKGSSSLTRKIIAMTVLVCGLTVPVYAKTYEVDSVSEDDFKSALAVDYTKYNTGVNTLKGTATVGIETITASGLKTVTVGINATHAYLPNDQIVLVQGSAVPSNENYNTYIGRFHTLEKTESERMAVITNKGALSKSSKGTLSADSAMSADGTEFTGTYTAENGNVYSIVGKRGAKQPSGLYAWTTTITDQYGNVHTTSSINYMSIENPPADVTNVYTVKAKYEDGNWSTSIVDQNGNPPTDPKMTTITGPTENKNLELKVGEVNKKKNGYFMTNQVKTTGQVTGTEAVSQTTVQTGDVVTATVNANGTKHANDDSLTIKVNGEEVANYTGVHYYSINDNGKHGSNYNNTGATGVDSLAAGVGTSASGILSSVAGSHSSVSGGTLMNLGGVGATVYGAVNTVKVAKQFDGVANSVIGIANATSNANGALIWGAGNSIENAFGEVKDSGSIMSAYMAYIARPNDSTLTALQSALAGAVAESGGNVMAIGGANKAGTGGDVSYSQLMGVSNELKSGKYNYLDGYKNTVEGDNNVAIGTEHTVTGNKNIAIGTNHTVKGGGNAVFGDPNTVTGDNNLVLANESTVTGEGNVALGNAASITASDAVAAGNSTSVTVDGGVALGTGAVASTDKGVTGYDPETEAESTFTTSAWKSTAAAVSVGDGSNVTRQITGVAAGTNDTDAVNVAQLKKAGSSITFNGDMGDAIEKPKKVNIIGGITDESKLTKDDNIGVVATASDEGGELKIRLAKDIKGVDSITVNKNIKVGDNTTIEGDTITTKTVNADTVKVGGTTINDNGITTNNGNGPAVTKDGIDAGGKKITNVAPGTADNDAVNMSQLKNASGDIYNEINRLDNSTRKGIAGAAALAALHPMDFNPDDKLQFSAGVGNYRGETAAALGMFYRPDESVMFSIGGTFGNSDNMINAGITFGLDGTRNRITRSRTAMAREIQDLRSLVTQMAARMDRLEGVNIETAMFPDVPENHWAYEYVEDLQKRGALEGYPDGLFKGDRAMTRYEFAAMLDRMVRSGVTLDSKIAKEFEPELGRICVERISGQDNGRKKVERVRVNNSDSKYPEGKTRDVYGSKIVTEVPKAAEAK